MLYNEKRNLLKTVRRSRTKLTEALMALRDNPSYTMLYNGYLPLELSLEEKIDLRTKVLDVTIAAEFYYRDVDALIAYITRPPLWKRIFNR